MRNGYGPESCGLGSVKSSGFCDRKPVLQMPGDWGYRRPSAGSNQTSLRRPTGDRSTPGPFPGVMSGDAAISFGERMAKIADAHEQKLIWLFAILFFIGNLLTSDLYPTCWCDEPMFSDPAIHFAQGKGFVSTAWWQPKEVTWSGNVPLYDGALSLWVKLFGVGLVRVRAFNYLAMTLTIPLFWAGVKRLGCVRSAAARLGMVFTIFLSYSFLFAFRSARPDCLGILICAWALWSWTAPDRKVKYGCLFLAGCLLPASGLQLIGFFGLAGALAMLLEGKRAVAPLLAAGGGIVAGGLILFGYYYFNHLDGVLVTIRETRQAHDAAVAAAARSKLFILAKRIVLEQVKDLGVMPVLLALAFLAIDRRVWSDARTKYLPLLGWAVSFAFVAALEVFLHYLEYYHWMNVVIAGIILFAILSQTWGGLRPWTKAAMVLLLAGEFAAGLPLRLGLGLATGQHHEYEELKRLAAEKIKPTDVVFTDYLGYFPARDRAAEVYVPPYLKVMTDAERASVNVLMVDAAGINGYTNDFIHNQAEWKRIGGFSSELGPVGQWVLRRFPHYRRQPTNYGYAVTMYRREPPDAGGGQAAR